MPKSLQELITGVPKEETGSGLMRLGRKVEELHSPILGALKSLLPGDDPAEQPPQEFAPVPTAQPAPAPQEPAPQPTQPPTEEMRLAISNMTNSLVMGDNPGLMQGVERSIKQMMRGARIPQFEPLDPEDVTEVEGRMQQAAAFAGEQAERVTKRALQLQDYFNQSKVNAAVEAEQEARESWEDANFVLAHGMGREEFEGSAARIAEIDTLLQEDPTLPGLQEERQQLIQEVNEARAKTEEPNPMRLWSNMGGFQQFLFILMNAIGGAASAITGGPTPLDVAFDMMERDYQAQKDAYQRMRDKQQVAQSAYSMAARRTDSELERSALAKNWMLQAAEMRMEEAGLQGQAQQLRQHREQLRNNFAMARYRTKTQERIAAVNAALSLEANRTRLALGSMAEQPQVPYGTVALPGAPPLDDTARREVTGMLSEYQKMRGAVNELIEVRRQLNQMGVVERGVERVQAMSPFTTELEGRARNAASELIDAVRKFHEWGARFEKTEETLILPGFTGDIDPNALDPFGGVLSTLLQQSHMMPARLQQALSAYGLQAGPVYGVGGPGPQTQTEAQDPEARAARYGRE